MTRASQTPAKKERKQATIIDGLRFMMLMDLTAPPDVNFARVLAGCDAMSISETADTVTFTLTKRK